MNAIEKLQAERQRLVDRLEEIDKILGQYEEIQRLAESYLTADTRHTSRTDSDSGSREISEAPRGISGPRMSFMPGLRRPKTAMVDFERAVFDVLAEANKPLDRSALYKALLDRGVVIGSSSESSDLNTLSARMSRMKEKVVNVPGYGYWLRDRAFPQGGYEPESVDHTQSSESHRDDNLV